MPRGKKATAVQEGSAQLHGEDRKHGTKPAAESKSGLVEGVFSGLSKRVMPPTLDGIVRGVPKYVSKSLAPDTMSIAAGPTKMEHGAFGSGLFPEGKVGK